ncbi:MAG: peptidyl-prolyl cis-trans isomerase [Deltaproteobacteria bacterium]|nr:peptidyl-prolyl cis-trans isomerase [Deltaproteobacteria bacterium]
MTLFTLVVFQPLAAPDSAPRPIVATVDGRPIWLSSLLERRAETAEKGGNTRLEDLLEDLVNEDLLEAEARRLGLEERSEVSAAVEAKRKELAAERLVAVEAEAFAEVQESELREMYHLTADAVVLEHVVVMSEADAKAVLGRLAKGARLESEGAGSLDGAAKGKAQEILRAQLDPELAKAAFAAPLNEVVGPVALGVGYAVLRVLSRVVGDEAGFQSKRVDIQRFAIEGARKGYRKHLVDQFRRQKGVALDEPLVRSTGTRLDGPAAELAQAVAVIGNRRVTLGEVFAEVRRVFGGQIGSHFSGASVKLEYANRLVDAEVLGQAALERGFGDDQSLGEALESARRAALVRAATQRARAAAGAASDQEAEHWYDHNKSRLSAPARRACATLVSPNKAGADAARRRLAKGEPLEQLGGRATMITEESIEAGRMAGEAELAEAMRRPDKLSAPIQVSGGWAIVRCSARIPSGVPSFEETREQARAYATVARADRAVVDELRRLRKRANVRVDEGLLDARAQD